MTRGFEGSPPFPAAARITLGDTQLRRNLTAATGTIRAKRDRLVSELDTWEDLRIAAEAIKNSALGSLDRLLPLLEARVGEAGGVVHYARNAAEANRIIVGLVLACHVDSVVKVKSMTTAEVGMNQALEQAGITAFETDLAELIVQLGDDLPSHIVVPAIHKSRDQIRDTFTEHMGQWGRPAPPGLTNEPAALAGAARLHLRERFLQAEVGISGGNFLVAETGSLVVVESEGNGRMCLTLPQTLISLVGIDKIIPRWEDLDVFLQLLPRSATGERMNPYTSLWTGVSPGDGPQQFHLVLLDNGRSSALADEVGRQALRCIRCAACLNVCPVYERVGGHAYGSVYPGPIGAVLTPQLDGVATDAVSASLPYASTLCGACFDACPVRIDIPRLLVHLRSEVVDEARGDKRPSQERVIMEAASLALAGPRRLAFVSRLGALAGRVASARRLRLPGYLGGWTAARDLPLPAEAPFSSWWHRTHPDPEPPTGRAARVGSTDPARRQSSDRRARPGRGSGAGSRPGGPPPGAREEILAKISSALRAAPGPAAPVPRRYRRPPRAEMEPPVDLFIRRVSSYRARVHHIGDRELASCLAKCLKDHASTTVVVPDGLPEAWLSRLEVEILRDHPPLSTTRLDQIDSVITTGAAAIAETGTVVLDSGAGQGRRALSLLPDHHVVVIYEDQIVPDVPDVIGRIDHRAPQTWISGPSATSDIELSRVEGVHGPRELDVVVVQRTKD
jgi:L-lactate dehydrogenase complex protein LldF